MGGIDSIGAQGAGGAQPTETTNETSPMTPKGTADKAQRTEMTHTDSLARSDSTDELSGGGASGKDDFAEIDDALASSVQPPVAGKVESSKNPWFTVSFAAEFFEVMSKLTTLLKEMKLDDSKTLVMCQKLTFEMKQLEADFVKEASNMEAAKHYTSAVVSLASAGVSLVTSAIALGVASKMGGVEASGVMTTVNQLGGALNQTVSALGEIAKGYYETEKGTADSERTGLQGLEQAWEQFTQSMRGQLDTGKSETQAAFKLLEETLAKIMQQSAFGS